MLDLVHLSHRSLFPPGGIDICRQIALLTGMRKGDEVLVIPSGLGVTLEHFVREYAVVGSGVEDDPILLERAQERLRVIGMLERVHAQAGQMDGLPFRDGIFDVVIAELGLTSHVSAESAVSEMVRVLKPGASIVLVQPVWKTPVDSVRREVLSQHLGCRPLMVVEWKRLLGDAGVEGLHTEDWSDEETAFRPQITKPFPDFTVGRALARVREVHKLLTQERALGLDLVMGLKRVETASEGVPAEQARDVEAPAESAPEEEAEQVTGLPLFGDKGEGKR